MDFCVLPNIRLNNASKRAIQNTSEATGNLINNKTADTATKSNNNKITRTMSRSNTCLRNQKKKKDIYSQKKKAVNYRRADNNGISKDDKFVP